jgi:hypothetical protein
LNWDFHHYLCWIPRDLHSIVILPDHAPPEVITLWPIAPTMTPEVPTTMPTPEKKEHAPYITHHPLTSSHPHSFRPSCKIIFFCFSNFLPHIKFCWDGFRENDLSHFKMIGLLFFEH